MIEVHKMPPPERLPASQIGETLGLCHGLRTQVQNEQWRCAQCSKMWPAGSILVWVPDGVRVGDPAWSVEEAARISFMNGSASGWCVDCTPKVPKPPMAAVEPLKLAVSIAPIAPIAWWRKLFKRTKGQPR